MRMTTIWVLTMAVFSLMAFAAGCAQAAEGRAPGKVLVAYFSWGGNTREIANQVHARVGGDLFEIETVNAYPAEYRACADIAKKEQNENARPALSTAVENMDAYDVVFIGYPIWWGTTPMALFTFFEQYDLAGKTIVPFCTHGGSGLSRSPSDIGKLCPQSKILAGIAIRGADVKSAQNELQSWLEKVGF